MRQAVMTQPGRIEFRDVPLPEPGAGEVRLRIYRIGVCGSDVHVYHGRHPFTSYPVVQGHEFSGAIDALGPDIPSLPSSPSHPSHLSHFSHPQLKIGDNVTALPQIVCGQCGPCLRGDCHICDALKVEGFQAPGCAQEFFVTKAEKVVPLPAGFTPEQGALVEPSAVAVHAVGRAARYAGSLKGRNVAVLGAGPIGNLVAQTARCEGASVLIADVSDFRLAVARQCGIAAGFNPKTESLADAARRVFGRAGFDVALECAAAEPALASAITAINKGGAIVVVGLFGSSPRVDMAVVQDRELCLFGTLMYQRADYEQAIALINGGGINTSPLDSKHFLFEQYAAAYQFIEEQGDKAMKVFIDVS